MSDNQMIARIIMEQLGGNKFRVMTGAKNFMSGDKQLIFALPSRFAKNGINKVRITLTPMDDYTVEFLKIVKMSVKEIAKVEGVYCDNLQSVFTEHTGLDTHL